MTTQRYPPKIQQLKHSMADAKALVEDLTSRLISAQHEYDELQREWLQYQGSIRRCPSEVLLMIFKLYLVKNPRIVRRLLLVCKQWYQVVTTSPELWTHILIKFTDVISTSETTNRYIDTCLQRSGSMLLEVDLDFRHLLSIRDQIVGEIFTNLGKFLSLEGRRALSNWVMILDTEPLHDGWTMPPRHLNYALEVIRKLTGQSGSTMKRWKSLDLQLPEHDRGQAQQLWDHFLYPTPNLTRMVVRPFCLLFLHHAKTVTHAFPDLSSLKHLDMHDAPDRQCFAVHGPSLKSLILYGGVRTWTATCLAHFINLQILELIGEYYFIHTSPSALCILSLPELRHLTLRGDFTFAHMMEFVAPKLRMLDIIQLDPFSSSSLPITQPPCIGWEPDPYWRSDRTQRMLQGELDKILIKYRTTEHLICPNFIRDLVIETIQQLKASGELSSALRTVEFKGDDGDADARDVWSVA